MTRALTLVPSRRRRKYRVTVKRSVTFGPGLAVPLWGWADLGQPLHLAGLAVMSVLGLLVVTNLVVAVMLVPMAVRQYAWVPRSRRIAYRQRHGRQGARSSYIPDRMRKVTYYADRNQCVMRRWWRPRTCQGGLECDHSVPWAGGGTTTLPNLFTACQYHNGLKLNYSRDRDGYEHYAGNRSAANLAAARDILHAEKMAGRNPLRGLRMAWALGA
jgi:hypothetical protein